MCVRLNPAKAHLTGSPHRPGHLHLPRPPNSPERTPNHPRRICSTSPRPRLPSTVRLSCSQVSPPRCSHNGADGQHHIVQAVRTLINHHKFSRRCPSRRASHISSRLLPLAQGRNCRSRATSRNHPNRQEALTRSGCPHCRPLGAQSQEAGPTRQVSVTRSLPPVHRNLNPRPNLPTPSPAGKDRA